MHSSSLIGLENSGLVQVFKFSILSSFKLKKASLLILHRFPGEKSQLTVFKPPKNDFVIFCNGQYKKINMFYEIK